MRYLALGILILSACGKAPVGSPDNPAPLPTAPSSIHVQLNAQQTYVMGTESVQLNDARHFTAPSSVQVVGGTFNCGSPGCNSSVMRANIEVAGVTCRYESSNVNAAYMALLDCNEAPTAMYLQSGNVITLNPLYAPGLLLEVQFFLVK